MRRRNLVAPFQGYIKHKVLAPSQGVALGYSVLPLWGIKADDRLRLLDIVALRVKSAKRLLISCISSKFSQLVYLEYFVCVAIFLACSTISCKQELKQ